MYKIVCPRCGLPQSIPKEVESDDYLDCCHCTKKFVNPVKAYVDEKNLYLITIFIGIVSYAIFCIINEC